ncbi:MAG: MFS transporter [Burkholderiales bacterium]|nr:MFS transporter [Burkholderiales bacterium]
MKTPPYYGYAIVAASFVVQGVTIGGVFAYGVLFKELEAEFGWSRAAIAGASSVSMIVMGIMAVVAGRLNDRIGPRGLLTASALFYGVAFMLLATLQAQWQLYLFYGLLVGIGLCTHDVVTLSTVARWFSRRRGLASGIVKCGTGTGQLVIPLAVAALVAAFGWRTACVVFGAAALLVLVAAAQPMRRDPQSAGLRSPQASPEPVPPAPQALRAEPAAEGQAHRPLLWLLCGVQFLVFSCLVTTQVHIAAHAADLGLSRTAAAGVLSTVGGVSVLGRLVVGAVIDRLGGRRALIGCFATLLASFVWLQFATTPSTLFAFAALYGLAHGGFFTVMSPTVAEYFGLRAHGMLFGTVLLFGSIGGAIGPLAAGASFDASGSYRIAFVTLGVIAASGLVLVTSLLPRKRGPRAAVAAPS